MPIISVLEPWTDGHPANLFPGMMAEELVPTVFINEFSDL